MQVCLHRENPNKWSFYRSAAIALKTLHDKNPNKHHSLLISSYFEEPRKVRLGTFFDKPKARGGKWSIQYGLDQIKLLEWPWIDVNLSNDSIRMLLKDLF